MKALSRASQVNRARDSGINPFLMKSYRHQIKYYAGNGSARALKATLNVSLVRAIAFSVSLQAGGWQPFGGPGLNDDRATLDKKKKLYEQKSQNNHTD